VIITSVGVVLLLATGAGSAAAHAEEPKRAGLKESVQVRLVPLEVTVWPKQVGSDACVGLTIDDFELRVDGRPQEIYAVDALGASQEVYKQDTVPSAATSTGGLSFVLLFDLWHLDLFYRNFSACPITKPLAFDQARRFVGEEFHDGDRLLLVTSAGWPVVHEGWLRNRADALAALARLEKNRQVMAPRQEHINHNGWIAGMESLFLALGRYPGRKDVIYLADDFRFDDVAMRMFDIAARAQANGVVMSAVDLLASCRTVIGPPCVKIGGGLGCTIFRDPIALNPLARDTGGQLFPTDRIAAAAHELREMRKCRYLVSFRKDLHSGNRTPSIQLDLREGLRHELTLFAPSSYETAATAPSKTDTDDALFLLPRFGRGLSADTALWPYVPKGKGGRWSVFILARVDRTDEEPWPDDVTELTITVLLHKQSKGYGKYTKKIAGDELMRFKDKGGTGTMLFPMDGIRPGDTTIDLTVVANTDELSANVSKSTMVPNPPRPGEAGPWYVSNRLDRVGGEAVFAPSFDDVVTQGEFVSFIGYGCPVPEHAPEFYTGSLVPPDGGAPIAVAMRWLKRPDGSRRECGWLAGKMNAPAQTGHWTFMPPADLKAQPGFSGLPLDVVPTIATEIATPAEVRP
jgi:hypothetical protein